MPYGGERLTGPRASGSMCHQLHSVVDNRIDFVYVPGPDSRRSDRAYPLLGTEGEGQ